MSIIFFFANRLYNIPHGSIEEDKIDIIFGAGTSGRRAGLFGTVYGLLFIIIGLTGSLFSIPYLVLSGLQFGIHFTAKSAIDSDILDNREWYDWGKYRGL